VSEATIHIDGSQGEGGGQIVRSSLALSMVTGKPVSIDRVRAGREKPGLMRQHLTAVRAAKEISGATVTGDAIGSSTLTFHPGEVVPGEYHFAVGTAGSATLVLQTVLPPLLIAEHSSRLILEGGTHNPWAPPWDFVQQSYLPLINRMGPRVSATLERPGFFPAGGGRFVIEIEPRKTTEPNADPAVTPQPGFLSGLTLLERGDIRSRRGRVLLSNLPEHIAQRELDELRRLGSWDDDGLVRETVVAHGPGNVVLVEIESQHVTEVFVGFGEHGVKAEAVVRRAIDELRDYLKSGAPVGPYLADQLLLPMGIAAWQATRAGQRQSSSFCTLPLTEHSRTHIAVLRSFLGIEIGAVPQQQGCVVVTVG